MAIVMAQQLPSGYVKIAIGKWPSRNSGFIIYPLKIVMFQQTVKLPEGNSFLYG